MQLASRSRALYVVVAYGPTDRAPGEQKSALGAQLDAAVAAAPPASPVVVLGDLNARVGSHTDAWPG
eukprot:186958-Chlamydomonas_euryale.AAC.1